MVNSNFTGGESQAGRNAGGDAKRDLPRLCSRVETTRVPCLHRKTPTHHAKFKFIQPNRGKWRTGQPAAQAAVKACPSASNHFSQYRGLHSGFPGVSSGPSPLLPLAFFPLVAPTCRAEAQGEGGSHAKAEAKRRRTKVGVGRSK